VEDVAPALAVVLPDGQLVQAAEPVVLLYVPMLQILHEQICLKIIVVEIQAAPHLSVHAVTSVGSATLLDDTPIIAPKSIVLLGEFLMYHSNMPSQ